MADNEHSAEDRTEAATAQRLERARKSGQIPVSRDATVLASLLGATLGAVFLASEQATQLAKRCADVLGLLDRVRLDSPMGSAGPLTGMLLSAGLLLASVALPAAACSVGCVLLQTQFYIGGAPVRFDLSRISPATGFARICSIRNLTEFLKASGRLLVLSLIGWAVLSGSRDPALATLDKDAGWLVPAAHDLVGSLVKPFLLVLTAFAAADLLLVRFQHARSLRMTKEQVRLEARESEGDPLVKAKLRRIRQQRARRRMMAKVKTAAVVITNPTHYAVALFYARDGSGAPRVIAKGTDEVAARIREEAKEHGVPIVPSPPLARSLYTVELDQEIPVEHYKAVAEVIAFVWKLNARVGAGAQR